MLRNMIEKIEEMAAVQMLTYGNREYTDKQIYPVKDPLPCPLFPCAHAHRIAGLSEMQCGRSGLSGFAASGHRPRRGGPFVIPLRGSFCNRHAYIDAMADVPAIPFGKYQDVEAFIIMMQSMFEATKDRDGHFANRRQS